MCSDAPAHGGHSYLHSMLGEIQGAGDNLNQHISSLSSQNAS